MKREKIISGQKGLGRAAGVSQKTVSEWLRDRAWTWGRGPWKTSDVPGILQFARGRKRRSNDPAVAGKLMGSGITAGKIGGFSKDVSELSPLERASISVKLETAASRKVDREIKLGKYVLKEDVEKERVARIHAVKNAMLALPDSGIVESIRAAENEHEAKEILRGRIYEMCQAFAVGKH